jgi:hypothetical protein
VLQAAEQQGDENQREEAAHHDQCSFVMVDSMSSLAEMTRLFIS